MIKSLVLLLALLSSTANALPVFKAAAENHSVDFVGQYNFNGIARSNSCSASVVKYKTSKVYDKAVVLTNGHCINMGKKVILGMKMPAAGEVLVNVPAKVIFDLLSDDGESFIGRVSSETLIYGTMTNTDLALYQLEKTYDQIESEFKVKPLILANNPAPLGTGILILSGLWQKGYRCSIEEYVHSLVEAIWTWRDSIRYTSVGCELVPGTSGSPILSLSTGEVIGINNTHNAGGEACSLNNPCEKSANGSTKTFSNRGYGQHTDWIYSCLNKENQIDLSLGGCQLPKPALMND